MEYDALDIEQSGSVFLLKVNTDSIGYENYIRMRKRNDDKQAEMDAMKKELETLKSMLNELAS